MTVTPPDDKSSLLVPIFLDAWALYSLNQTGYAWYKNDYTNLEDFQSPVELSSTPPVTGELCNEPSARKVVRTM